ncbi:sorbosone dehydrogenase family protein [Oceanicella sp. SM1341]|uniref:PQQ-dependent sugar dehydrogenase n=1 Tax=Oceanicella sp. SM1341 TaxID=1548889 RepID=UPI000E51EA22|nr:PQQ-dependent sugar dehydrogenase [Oceanicella sp. SM1341]
MKTTTPRPAPLLRALALAALLPLPAAAQDTLLGGLDYPWDIETGAGVFYITEKAGTIGTLEGGRFTRLPVQTSVPVLDDRGGGLMGLALRPDFATTGRAVVYHHYGTPEARLNRVIEVERGADAWTETRVLLDAIPGHPLYNGGRLAFGPDGMLYITTGWTGNHALPQDPGSLAGKILRLAPDGSVPADNPFPGSPVWSVGHRNPQGIAFDDEGRLFAAEHGQSGNDEVNRIARGANYGWPLVEGDGAGAGMTPPLAHSGRSTWAPSGLAWHAGRLLVAGLRAEAVLGVSPDGTVAAAFPAGERIRDVLVSGDEVYAITTNRSPRRDGPSEDRLIRLAP